MSHLNSRCSIVFIELLCIDSRCSPVFREHREYADIREKHSRETSELLRINPQNWRSFSPISAKVFPAFDFSNTGEARICRILGHAFPAFGSCVSRIWVMRLPHLGHASAAFSKMRLAHFGSRRGYEAVSGDPRHFTRIWRGSATPP